MCMPINFFFSLNPIMSSDVVCKLPFVLSAPKPEMDALPAPRRVDSPAMVEDGMGVGRVINFVDIFRFRCSAI